MELINDSVIGRPEIQSPPDTQRAGEHAYRLLLLTGSSSSQAPPPHRLLLLAAGLHLLSDGGGACGHLAGVA